MTRGRRRESAKDERTRKSLYAFPLPRSRSTEKRRKKVFLGYTGLRRFFLLALGKDSSAFHSTEEDVVGRVSVQGSLESLLVQVVTNETNRSSQDKDTVQGTNLDVFVGLFRCKGARVS